MQLKPLILAAAATFIAAPALAMDLPPVVFEGQEASPLSIGQGWYIRGDFGANYSPTMGKPSYRTYRAGTDSYTSQGFDEGRLSSDFSYGLGVGYQFTDYMRTDLTMDYFSGRFDGKSGWRNPCTPNYGTATTSCRYESQTFGALGLMANGYIDLGTYWGITPYLGGGAGVTYVQWSGVNQKLSCSAAAASDCNQINFRLADLPGADSWRLTYALMAGMSYDLSAHTKIDLGYRLSHIGSGDMFGFSDYEQSKGAFGAKGRDKGITRHEFRAGLRLTTW